MFRSLIVSLALALSGASLSAQDFRAQISGQVLDQAGAAIPGAKVRAVQKNTGQATETTTNHEGYYTLTYLLPSDYDVEASATGFKTTRRENVTLLVSQKLDLPFKLEVGGVSAEVTVTAEAPELIQTADASGGLNFDSLMTSEYALNGRQVYMLMDLTPGVLFTQEQFGATGFSGTRGWDVNSNYVMNGGKLGSNSFSLNGAPISLNGMWQVAPNVDAIQEFKVSTNQYDAGQGRTGGGSVNTTLKGGTNQWHGTLSHFIRNNVLDANYTQLNAAGKPRGKHIVNQFSGTLGGPLRKNKDFIFFSFEGWRERVPFPVVADTPPLDLRTGQNFTQYGVTYLIYDPLTAHPCVNGKDVPGTCSSPTIRDPFPGNVLPQSRISPIGQKLLTFFPAQNYTGLVNNYVAGTGGKYHYNQPMARWDRQIDDNNRLFAVFTFQRGGEYRLSSGIPGPAAAGNMYTQRSSLNSIVDWTRILSPTAVLDVRASYGRFWQLFPNTDFTSGVTAESVGMTRMIQAPTNPEPYPPRINIDQYTQLFGTGSVVTFRAENQTNLAPSITMTRGTKTIKFGVDVLYVGQGIADSGNSKGYLQFNRWGTQRYPQRSALNAQDGNGIADILLGIPGAGQIDWNDTYYRSYPYYGIFIQNDWKLSRTLTVNIGLRYEVQLPAVERFDRQNTGFDYNAVNPLSDQILAKWRQYQATYNATNPRYPYPDPPKAIYGGKTFIERGGNRRIFDTDWTNIQPRVGVAWNFMRNTVLRTGFGIYHRTILSNTLTGETDGFSQTTNYTRSLDGNITPSAQLTGPYSLQQPFPDGLTAPAGRDGGLLTNAGNAQTYSGRNRPIPRTYQYSFGFQRRAPFNILLDACPPAVAGRRSGSAPTACC
ncbi:MAG: carboxypeptidase-like regulatory domain-containing protein [Acidobacteria bacterium]|nr:carboxypeptidase-like regulatory domain-containing protein [Acidobacteriota bacterium]